MVYQSLLLVVILARLFEFTGYLRADMTSRVIGNPTVFGAVDSTFES